MQFKVRHNGISPRRVKVLLASCDYFMDTMLTAKHKNKIKTFRFFLDLSCKRDGDYGYQTELAELPGLYTIAIAKESILREAVEYTAHEFVHLRQTLSGRFRLVPTGKRGKYEWFWDGVSYGVNPYHGLMTQECHRNKLPWEAEAYDLQASLARGCFEHLIESGIRVSFP